MIGQHFNYKHRYPKAEEYFGTSDYQNRHLANDQKKLIASYDNATRYNDMVIDSILNYFESKNAVIVYLADHGEEVFDDLPVRGRLFQKPTRRQICQEFEVPFWIWCSPAYRLSHEKIVERIKASVNNPVMIDD